MPVRIKSEFTRNNWLFFCSSVALHVFLFCLYKYYFPLPDFYQDSYSYIHAAVHNEQAYYRPFGYSWLLWAIHQVSDNANVVAGIQYFLLSAASLFHILSIEYLLGFPNRVIKWIARALIIVNPFMLALSNLMVSDSVFAALTIIWVTLLLWILVKGKWWALVMQIILLYAAFQVRYNALYYPVIACIVFIIARNAGIYYRLAGIAGTVSVIVLSYQYVKTQTERSTGAPVFSGFAGWQLANNALHIYKHVDIRTEQFEEPALQELDRYVKRYIDSIPDGERMAMEDGKTGTSYMWKSQGPLRQYHKAYMEKTGLPHRKAWYKLSTLYGAYGRHIIRHYPVAFSRYFLCRNAISFLLPDTEALETYNVMKLNPDADTREWYHIKEGQLYARAPVIQERMIMIYPAGHLLIVIFALLAPMALLVRKRMVWRDSPDTYVVIFWYIILLANIAFSIFSSTVMLRYEGAWFILGFGIPLWCLARLLQVARGRPIAMKTT